MTRTSAWARFGDPAATLLLPAWAVCAGAQHVVRGRYALVAILLQVLGFAVFLCGRRGTDRLPTLENLLAGTAAALCLLTALVPRLAYVARFRTHGVFLAVHLVAAVLLSAQLSPTLRRKVPHLLTIAGLLLVLARLLPPVISPVPHIDAWTLQQQAADFALHGLNPYAADYAQIDPPQRYGYVAHFGYLPLVLVLDVAGRTLLRDVRFAYALCDVATAWLLWRLVRPRSEALGRALAVTFLAVPMGTFVVEQAWSEPLLLLCATLAVTTWAGSDRRAGLGAGLLLSAKQSNLLLAPLILAQGQPWRRLLWAALMALALLLPALLWNPQAFLQSTVLGLTGMPPRPDGFSLWTVAYRVWDVQLPVVWTILPVASLAVASLAWAVRRDPVRTLGMTIAACWALYLTARQSFGNYHYFVSALLLVWLAARWRAHPVEAA